MEIDTGIWQNCEVFPVSSLGTCYLITRMF